MTLSAYKHTTHWIDTVSVIMTKTSDILLYLIIYDDNNKKIDYEHT